MLGEAVGKSDKPPKRLEKLSESPTGRQNVRRDFRTFRQAAQTLGEAFGKSDGVGKTTDDTTDTDTPDEGGTDTPELEPEEPGGDEGEGGSPL